MGVYEYVNVCSADNETLTLIGVPFGFVYMGYSESERLTEAFG